MDVVLNSHIALLVLGYLYEEKLDNVSKLFCKFSPHLEEEYQIIKKGLRPVVLNSGSLSAIVREHCYIKSKVDEIVRTFPSNINAAFDRQTLSGKVNHLLKIVKKTIGESDSINLKRTRSEVSSSEKTSSTDTTQVEDLPGFCPKKKRRIADSYIFVQNDFSEDSDSEEETEGVENDTEVQTTFADRILGDKNFQTRFLPNINKAINDKNKDESLTVIDSSPTTNNNLKKMIQNIIAVTERGRSFDEAIKDVMTDSLLENSKFSNRLRTNINKEAREFSAEKSFNFLNEIGVPSQAEFSQIFVGAPNTKYIGLDKSNNSNYVRKIIGPEISQDETVTEETNTNMTASKFLFMKTNDNVEGNLQTFGPFKNDQVLLDLNDIQTFPIVLGNDGSMYINSKPVQNNILQGNNVRVDSENTNIIHSETNINLNPIETEFIKDGKNSSSCKIRSSSPSIVLVDSNKSNLSSLECKILKDKQTPDNIVFANKSIGKSLSTPRRKTSHVRVLNFSPLKNLKTFNKKGNAHSFQTNNLSEKKMERNISDALLIEDASVVVSSNSFVENESSNSTDITGDHSNATVIQCKMSSNDDTPKRKTCVVTCRRNISSSNSEEQRDEISAGKDNIIKLTKLNKSKEETNPVKMEQKKQTKIKKKNNFKPNSKQSSGIVQKNNLECSKVIDPMEEWKLIREKSKDPNFDQLLREMHSKTPTADSHIQKRRKLRRKIGAKSVKNTKSPGIIEFSNDQKQGGEVVPKNNPDNSLQNNSKETVKNIEKKGTQEKKAKSIEPKTNFLNFRIKTPMKGNLNDTKKKIKKTVSKMRVNKKEMKNEELYDAEKQPICIEETLHAHTQLEKISDGSQNGKMPLAFSQPCNEIQKKVSEDNCELQNINKEQEKRTANIAHILDTPFKLDESNLIPPTPGIILSNNLLNNAVTPMTKISFSSSNIMRNIDIKTPAFAITPGGNLTYSTDKETPKSGIKTDYSSGGSYYRPDDSVDINKKLDQELSAKFDWHHRKSNQIEDKSSADVANNFKNEKNETSNYNAQNKAHDGIATEIIACPVVLKKVKSLSDEVLDVVPHYKFVEAGLPDITDESTTSSSSDECSSCSSQSLSSDKDSNTKNVCSKEMQPLSVLSNIDSSEDEEWEIQSHSKNKILMEENSQLLSNDGEVRIPVRSWKTPKKNEIHEIMQERPLYPIIADNTLSVFEKASDKEIEIKDKLSQDSNEQKITVKTDLNCTKWSEKSPQKTELSDNQLDVLAALNLSAKKKDTNHTIFENNEIQNTNKKSLSSQVDDNATSDLFTLRMEEESVSNDSQDIRNAALTLTKMKTRRMSVVEYRTIKSITAGKGEYRSIKPITSGKGEHRSIKTITTAKGEQLSKKNETKEKDDSHRQGKAQQFVAKPKTEPGIANSIKSKKNLNLRKESRVLSKKGIDKQSKVITHSESGNSYKHKKSKNANSPTGICLLEENLNIDKIKDNSDIDLNTQLKKCDKVDKYKEVKTNEGVAHTGINISDKLNTNSEFESESEDPYDECKPFYTDENQKNLRHIIFDESITNLPVTITEKLDLSKIAMKITISGQNHKIDCSEEISLFILEPKLKDNNSILIKNKENSIKKKVKVNKIQKTEGLEIKESIANKKRIVINKSKGPTKTPIPFLRKGKIPHRNKFSSDQDISQKKISPKDNNNKDSLEDERSNQKHITSATASIQESSKKNIRNEDINAVLSHLYGNGK